jgi:hypothetical protein
VKEEEAVSERHRGPAKRCGAVIGGRVHVSASDHSVHQHSHAPHFKRRTQYTAPMDPSLEQQILNKYNLTTLYPTRWPDEKNDDSDSDAEAASTAAAPAGVRRSRSRYTVLEDRSRFSRQVPGAERSKDGKENLVQKDEQDPLGMYPSVVQVLRTRNIQVEEDIRLRRWT